MAVQDATHRRTVADTAKVPPTAPAAEAHHHDHEHEHDQSHDGTHDDAHDHAHDHTDDHALNHDVQPLAAAGKLGRK